MEHISTRYDRMHDREKQRLRAHSHYAVGTAIEILLPEGATHAVIARANTLTEK